MTHEEKIKFLRDIIFFNNVPSKELERVASVMVEKIYKKNSTIFFENEPGETMYFIRGGFIKISRFADDGRSKILAILKPLDYFGEMAVLDEEYRSARADVLEDAAVLVLYKSDLLQLIKTNPQIALQIITTLSQRLRLANMQIEDLTFVDTRKRIINTFMRLGETFGEQTGRNRLLLKIHLTHQDIGDLVGTSRETITRYLSKFQSEGILRVVKPFFEVTDLERFQHIADAPEE